MALHVLLVIHVCSVYKTGLQYYMKYKKVWLIAEFRDYRV